MTLKLQPYLEWDIAPSPRSKRDPATVEAVFGEFSNFGCPGRGSPDIDLIQRRHTFQLPLNAVLTQY